LHIGQLFSQGWFATPQDVLHADWQEVWHSPQPPSQLTRLRVASVRMRPVFSQGWFATPQDVLHADWQEVWHSPQPPSLLTRLRVFKVLI
jgi:hypothetical protein